MIYKAITVCEDEFNEVVEFNSQLELESYAMGFCTGAGCYGAGRVAVYTVDDIPELELSNEPADKSIIEMIKTHLMDN